jgi:site-specific DNA-cytosine methylase
VSTFVDVYGFAGGFALGMTNAGFGLMGKCEDAGGFGAPNMLNNKHMLGGAWELQAQAEPWDTVKAQIVAGNPPCSGFSMMSEPSFRGVESKVNACMWRLVEYASRVNPDAVVFESVQGAFTKGYTLMKALHADLERRTGEHWRLHHVLHDGFSVGGCQANRRRYFWVCAKDVVGVEPEETYKPALIEIIGDLQHLSLQWEKQVQLIEPSEYLVRKNIARRAVGSGMGQTSQHWSIDGHVDIRNPMNNKITELINYGDWPVRTQMSEAMKRHHERTGKLPAEWSEQFKEKMLRTDFNMGYTQPFRWAYDEPARVIHGGALYTSVHPEESRCLTHREAARIMGFPDEWTIAPMRETKGAALFWGKGIAVQAGQWIGQWLKESLRGKPGAETGTQVGEREYVIDVTSTRYGKPSQWRKTPDENT